MERTFFPVNAGRLSPTLMALLMPLLIASGLPAYASLDTQINEPTLMAMEKAEFTALPSSVDLVSRIGSNNSATFQLKAPGNIKEMRLVFGKIKLSDGAYLQVSSSDNREVYTYAQADFYSPQGIADFESEGFKASELTVRLVYPEGKPAKEDTVLITGYRAELQPRARVIIGASQMKQAVCYKSGNKDDMYRRSLAVSQIISNAYGTGWNIAGGPYVVTNHHVAGNIGAKSHQLKYNYESTDCAREVVDNSNMVTIRTTAVVAAGKGPGAPEGNNDWAVYKVDELAWQEAGIVPFFGALALDTTKNNGEIKGVPLYIPQHAGAKAKVITDVADDGKACLVVGAVGSDVRYNCDTFGGSSGSPVISQQNHGVVGVHWGARVAGTNSAVTSRAFYDGIKAILPGSNLPGAAVVGKGNIKVATLAMIPLQPVGINTGITQPFTIEALDASRMSREQDYYLFQAKGRNAKGEVKQVNVRLRDNAETGIINVSVLREDNPEINDALLTGWMAFSLNSVATGENVKNLVIPFSWENYDPFTSPFDPDAEVKTLTVTESKPAISEAIQHHSNFGFLTVRNGQGPLSLTTNISSYSVLTIPVKDAKGVVRMIKLRGQRKISCSADAKAMNTWNGCGTGARPASLIVSFVKADNPGLPRGQHRGMLPVVASRDSFSVPMLIDVNINN